MNILGSVKFWLDDVYDNPKEIYKTPMRNIRSFKDSFKRSCRWFAGSRGLQYCHSYRGW